MWKNPCQIYSHEHIVFGAFIILADGGGVGGGLSSHLVHPLIHWACKYLTQKEREKKIQQQQTFREQVLPNNLHIPAAEQLIKRMRFFTLYPFTNTDLD